MSDTLSRERSSSASLPVTAVTTPEAVSSDDIWASDSDHGYDLTNRSERRDAASDMLSDLPTIRRQHITDGYREGLSVGKAKVMQKGFDDGYPLGTSIALRVGKVLGYLEGILAAKDIDDVVKAPVRKIYEQAKLDLAVTVLLKDKTDQDMVTSEGLMASIGRVLSKWEIQVLGSLMISESESFVPQRS